MFTSLMVWLEFFLPPMMLPGIELTSVHLCLLEGPDFLTLHQLSYGSRGDKKVSIFSHFLYLFSGLVIGSHRGLRIRF